MSENRRLEAILKLPPNRVRRNYVGGAGIDLFHGQVQGIDSNRPEEWIGSFTKASNPGMEPVADEGLAFVLEHGERLLLKELVSENPEYYMGGSQAEPVSMEFLFKILDAGMRLHIQAHPDRGFSRKYLNEKYGKMECYYILNVKDPEKAHIWLGFQHTPGRSGWKTIIEKQDKTAMCACFEDIPVKPGEIWFIPGGLPHAIGKGITMLEIMEPSDLVVRCEFERKGIVVPEEARFMGRDLDFCLDIFDYNEYSVKDIQEKCRVNPVELFRREEGTLDCLIGEQVTDAFQVWRARTKSTFSIFKGRKPVLLVVVSGQGKIGGSQEYRKGDSFFLAAMEENILIEARAETELVLVL